MELSVGVLAALVGSVGAVSLLLRAGQGLATLFALWVLSPFAAMCLLCLLSKRWAALTRAALVGLTLSLTAGTLAIYANAAASRSAQGATFPFLVVPLAAWLLVATVIPAASLMSRRLSNHGVLRWLIRGIAGILMLLVAGTSFLLGLLLFDHHRDTFLPTPTGSFAVGRATFVWQEDPAESTADRRVLLGWIWYPAAREQHSETVDYLPGPWRAAMEERSGVLLSQLLTRDLARVQAHSLRDARLSAEQPAYPVVLMRGGGAALTTDYTTLAEDLASHGYVVVGFDAPHRSWVAVLPDGTIVPRAPQNDLDQVGGPQADRLAEALARAWAADCTFVLDRLERLNASDPTGKFRGRLDLGRVGVFGHSLGGATALLVCHDDSRCKAGIDVDGVPLGSVLSDGIDRPFMFVLGDHRGEAATDGQPEFIRNARANIRSIYDRLPGDRRLMIGIRGANHFLFSDNGALLKSPPVVRVLRWLGIVRLDGRRQLAVTARCVHTFFDAYLKGASAAQLRRELNGPDVEIAP